MCVCVCYIYVYIYIKHYKTQLMMVKMCNLYAGQKRQMAQISDVAAVHHYDSCLSTCSLCSSELRNCWALLIMYIIRLGSTYFMPKEWCVFNDSNTLPSLCNLIDRVLVSLTTINQHQGLSICRKNRLRGWFFFTWRTTSDTHCPSCRAGW